MLAESLSEEQVELFDVYESCRSEVEALNEESWFKKGFIMCAKLMREVNAEGEVDAEDEDEDGERVG